MLNSGWRAQIPQSFLGLTSLYLVYKPKLLIYKDNSIVGIQPYFVLFRTVFCYLIPILSSVVSMRLRILSSDCRSPSPIANDSHLRHISVVFMQQLVSYCEIVQQLCRFLLTKKKGQCRTLQQQPKQYCINDQVIFSYRGIKPLVFSGSSCTVTPSQQRYLINKPGENNEPV